jgi:hypothetical protein
LGEIEDGHLPEPPVPGLAQVGTQAPPARRSARLTSGRVAGARVPPMHYLEPPSAGLGPTKR